MVPMPATARLMLAEVRPLLLSLVMNRARVSGLAGKAWKLASSQNPMNSQSPLSMRHGQDYPTA